jgi:negative regulator of flagellin synthesis FlgM
VAVSDAGRQLAAIEATVTRGAALDADRVAALRAAIANGSYRLDSDRIAAAILRLERDS